MNTTEFLLLLDELLELPGGTLKGPEPLRSFPQWDSLAVVSFLALAGSQLEMAVDPGKIATAETVSDLMELVKDKLHG